MSLRIAAPALLLLAALSLCAAELRIVDATAAGIDPLRQITLKFALANHADVTVDRGTAGAKAVQLLREGKCSMAILEKSGVPAEPPAGCRVIPFAVEAFAVYVNAKNPLAGTSAAKLAEALTAGRPIWEMFGPGNSDHDLHRITLRSGSSGAALGHRLLRKEHFHASIFRVGSDEELLMLAGADPEAFAAGRFYPELSQELRPLAVDGVTPTPVTLRDGSYPLALRYALLIRSGDPEAEKFAAALTGADYRLILIDNGLIPLQKEDKL